MSGVVVPCTPPHGSLSSWVPKVLLAFILEQKNKRAAQPRGVANQKDNFASFVKTRTKCSQWISHSSNLGSLEDVGGLPSLTGALQQDPMDSFVQTRDRSLQWDKQEMEQEEATELPPLTISLLTKGSLATFNVAKTPPVAPNAEEPKEDDISFD